MLKKAINRLLTRAAQNRDCVFACVYRAATVRKSVPKSLFHQPARECGGWSLANGERSVVRYKHGTRPETDKKRGQGFRENP